MTRFRRDPGTWELVEVVEESEADSEATEESSESAEVSEAAAEDVSGATRPQEDEVSAESDGASRGFPATPSTTAPDGAGSEVASASVEAPHEASGAEASSDPETGGQPQAGGESAEPADGVDAVAAAQAEAKPVGELDSSLIPEPAAEDLDPVQVPEMHEVGCPDDLREEIEALMARYPQKRSASIPALWAIQRRYGWCTPEGIRQIAAVMQITPAYLESVASFYDLLRLTPIGEQRVLVCTNISCWMRGADELLESFCSAAGVDPHEAGHGGATSDDGKVFVSGFECLGACDIAPMASINERYFGPLENDEAATAVEQLRSGGDVLPEKALNKRPAAGGNPDPDPRVAS